MEKIIISGIIFALVFMISTTLTAVVSIKLYQFYLRRKEKKYLRRVYKKQAEVEQILKELDKLKTTMTAEEIDDLKRRLMLEVFSRERLGIDHYSC